MKYFLIFAAVISLTQAFYCPKPQRIGYMSYSTLVDYDNLTGLFRKIEGEQIIVAHCNVTQNTSSYNLTNIKPYIYYSDQNQRINYIHDDYTANVTAGDMYLVMQFDYQVKYENGDQIKGIARTHNKIDKFWFTKSIINQRGQLMWKVDKVNDLLFSEAPFISFSEPKLPFQDKLQIEYILSGQDPGCSAKGQIMKQINDLYKSDLQNWLENQHLLSTTTIKYQYKNGQVVQYLNHPYEFVLSEKGLIYEFHFEVQNYTKQCNQLNNTFQKEFGGNQQKIAIEQLRATVVKALTEGWLNVHLDKSWQIEQFQYYMGDLANYMQKAKQHTPIQPFDVNCKWNNSLYDVQLQPHQNHQLYVTIPYKCSFMVNQIAIQELVLNVGMIVTLTATRQNLVVSIYPSIGGVNIEFRQMNGYKITSYESATQCLKRILSSALGTKTLGTGFPLNKRDRPHIETNKQYILIYDVAEPF